MTRKNWTLLALAVVLGGFSLYLNRDWFSRDNIQIYHRSRPARIIFRRARSDTSAVNPIIFGFSRQLRLTSLKVVAVRDVETNKYPHALWHLATESNSVPIRDFMYGMAIKGLHPALKGAQPEPLEPGVKYRLYVEAGSFRTEHDFVPDPRTP